MPGRTDRVGHTKSFIYPVMDHWGKSQNSPAQGRFELSTCQSTVEHANHHTTMTAPSQRIGYTPNPERGGGGGFSLLGRSSMKTAPKKDKMYILGQ